MGAKKTPAMTPSWSPVALHQKLSSLRVGRNEFPDRHVVDTRPPTKPKERFHASPPIPLVAEPIRPVFDRLTASLAKRVAHYVFDLLWHNGSDWTMQAAQVNSLRFWQVVPVMKCSAGFPNENNSFPRVVSLLDLARVLCLPLGDISRARISLARLSCCYLTSRIRK